MAFFIGLGLLVWFIASVVMFVSNVNTSGGRLMAAWRRVVLFPMACGMMLLTLGFKCMMWVAIPIAEASDHWDLWQYNRRQASIGKWRDELPLGAILRAPAYDMTLGNTQETGFEYVTLVEVNGEYWTKVQYPDGRVKDAGIDSLYLYNVES